jgi:tRNA nucleotidyltransferase/poly(A) polymerase
VGELAAGLPLEVRGVLDRLRVAGIRAHVVGGALRDLVLGRPLRDVDIVVEGALAAAARALPGAKAIGGERPLLIFAERADRVRIEISALRGGAHELEGDLRLRDFTINALALDAATGACIDPLGGRADLAARRLRTPDPARAFRDDPVRVLRGVRLAAEHALAVEPATHLALERDSFLLAHAAAERVRDELLRILALQSDALLNALRELRGTGALAAVLPEALRGVGVAQNRHHVDDVHRHTLRVCALCPPRPLVRLAALLHDAAKPDCKRFTPRRGDFTFLRHDLAAVPHAERAAARLRLSGRDADLVARLVRHHLLYPERLAGARAIRRVLRRVGRDILDDLLSLRRADYASRAPNDPDHPDRGAPAAWLEVERRIRELAQAESPIEQNQGLAISGKDVMEALGIQAGPEVGRWLRRAERRAVEQPEQNERAALLTWLRGAANEAGGE